MSSSHCAIYNKLYPDLSTAVVTIATLSSLDVGPYIRCGLSGVCWPPWCRVTRAGSLTADSGRRGRLSQHFSSVVLLSAGHGTIINHKLLFHGNPAILLLQNHCHHDPFQIPLPLPVPSANANMHGISEFRPPPYLPTSISGHFAQTFSQNLWFCHISHCSGRHQASETTKATNTKFWWMYFLPQKRPCQQQEWIQ